LNSSAQSGDNPAGHEPNASTLEITLYNLALCDNLLETTRSVMRKPILLLSAAVLGLLASGCANTEAKFSRGVRDATEFARLGEIRRSMEQTYLLDGPEASYTTGFVKGFTKSLASTGVGVYEMVTAPFPPYDPPFPDYISPKPVYPDSYKPGIYNGSTYETDTYLGFSGGDVAPFIPGSRFFIFDN
jgi:putative exosortase-associated protein (TIGR04073 family)